MLLSQPTRQAVGLSLKGSLVVIDEAHNLPEAIRSLHTSRVTSVAVQKALEQLSAYTTRYAERFSGRNVLYLNQIRKILIAIQKLLTNTNEKCLYSVTEFLIHRRLENINLFRLLKYLRQSRLSQKLLGFTNLTLDQSRNSTVQTNEPSRHVSPLATIESFLEKLTLSGTDGKVLIEPPTTEKVASVQFVLLQPSIYLEDLRKEAHALALVGGTLRPFVHMATELLGDTESIQEGRNADLAMQTSTTYRMDHFTAFSCGHVVPASHVLLQRWRTGPSGQLLDFRYRSRMSSIVCDELGCCLLKMAEIVPNGMVVFLPSYSYETHLFNHWQASGLWQRLEKLKSIHRETKSARGVDGTLQRFASDAGSKQGALLFSVMGGKMSEGINFADERARCVVVVGLPFPDVSSPELKEKMMALDQTNSVSGKEYILNLCMRSVNQSVGRAIRHANDYATIVLLDVRYVSDERIYKALPAWLRRNATLANNKRWDNYLTELSSFYSKW